MILDFYHNKIVKETITDGFAESVRELLLPKLAQKYGDKLSGIQMYEDYISDGIVKNGIVYYPLTVILGEEYVTEWISYRLDSASFKNGIPYSYVGEGSLNIELADTVPAEIANILKGRRTYFSGDSLEIDISTTLDAVKLSGKYSQSFIDTLAEEVTRKIERAMSIRGLGKSGIILEMPFAPETYMEHTSENVTYRRLLISDKNSSAKDLWVKWTRENSAVGYSVSSHVLPGDMTVELGEDVSQKIREKEYRFLTRVSPTKYQSAMGRKNVTEWRELIKRAIKREDVEKVEMVIDEAAHASEISDKLAEILGKMGYTGAPGELPEINTVRDEEMEAALRAAGSIGDSLSADSEAVEEPILDFAPVGLELTLTEDETEEASEQTDEESAVEEPAVEEPAIEEPAVEESAAIEETVDEAELVIEETVDEEETADEEETVDEREELIYKLRLENIRLEAEAQERLMAEAERRKLAEAEAERHRIELEELKKAVEAQKAAELRERERLKELARAAEREKEREAELRRAEAEALRREIEAQKMAELRERERLRDAAVAELEERKRLEQEAKRAEEERLAEEARERAAAEEARLEAEREAERKRLLMEYTREEQTDFAPAEPEVKYTSYTAKLIFRHSVDPNSMVRIQELIKTTVAYYGKEHLKIRIKASIPDSMTVKLDFISIPEGEQELLVNIIKVLGNSDLGISRAILD